MSENPTSPFTEAAEPAPARAPISAFVITFNEEEQIGGCLSSLNFCDEIVVIDSYSTDRTIEIAKGMGAQVIQREWTGYRDQKQFGLDAVTHEWVLNLDADERVSPELRESILNVLTRCVREPDFDCAGYYMNRVVFYLGRWWRRGGWYPEYRLRFFRKSKTVWGGIEPHEKPIVDGKTERIEGELSHYTYDSLEEQLAQLQRFSTISAREEFQMGRGVSLSQLIFNPVMRFIKFYFFKRGFIEGTAGFVVAMAEAYYVFMKYAKIWELQFNKGQKK